MAAINQTQGTTVTWTSAGGDETLDLTSLANAAGRQGDEHDFGATFPERVRIELVVAVENLASQRVAAKVGALREGLMRNRLQINGVTHHAYLHSLVPEDMAGWPREG